MIKQGGLGIYAMNDSKELKNSFMEIYPAELAIFLDTYIQI